MVLKLEDQVTASGRYSQDKERSEMLLPRGQWCLHGHGVRYVICGSHKRYGGDGDCPLLSLRKP